MMISNNKMPIYEKSKTKGKDGSWLMSSHVNGFLSA